MTRNKLLGFVLLAGFVATAPSAAIEKGDEPPISDKVKEKLAAFERTGETVSCIGIRQIDEIKPLDDYRFLVRAGNDYYLNMVSGRCSRAASAFTRIEYTTSLSQLCRNEIIRVVDNSQGFEAGGCGLGDFERLKKKEETAGE